MDRCHGFREYSWMLLLNSNSYIKLRFCYSGSSSLLMGLYSEWHFASMCGRHEAIFVSEIVLCHSLWSCPCYHTSSIHIHSYTWSSSVLWPSLDSGLHFQTFILMVVYSAFLKTQYNVLPSWWDSCCPDMMRFRWSWPLPSQSCY